MKNSLEGLTIAVTSGRRATELAHLITSFGGKAYICPTIGVETDKDLCIAVVRRFLKTVQEYQVDYVIFVTGLSAFSLISSAERIGLKVELLEALHQSKVISRSPKLYRVLQNFGIIPDFIPAEYTIDGIATLLRTLNISGKKFAIFWHGSDSPHLVDQLREQGAQVFEYSTYSYSAGDDLDQADFLNSMKFNYIRSNEAKIVNLIEDINSGLIDAITFTSPPSVLNLFKVANSRGLRGMLTDSLNNSVIVVAVGSSTGKAIKDNMVEVDVMPSEYKLGPMIVALNDYAEKSPNRNGIAGKMNHGHQKSSADATVSIY